MTGIDRFQMLVATVVLTVANGALWIWCKLTGKPFKGIGGPQ